jgi:hypothetical protein
MHGLSISWANKITSVVGELAEGQQLVGNTLVGQVVQNTKDI